MKRYIFLIILIFIISYGCATAPKPYTANLRTNYQIEFKENFYLLSEALKRTFPSENINNNCLTFDIVTRKGITLNGRSPGATTKKLAEVCYSIDNNQIIRNARTYTSLNIHLNDWFAYITSKQTTLEVTYSELAFQYVTQKEQQKQEEADYQAKLASLKVDFKDETGRMSENVMKQLQQSLKIVPNKPQINIRYKNIIKRYKLETTSNLPVIPHYKSFKDNIIIRVIGYKVNPVPSFYELSDANLNVKAIYNFELSKVDELLFSNKTNDFITIHQIAGYFDNKIRDNLLKEPLTIPPMSKKAINWRGINTFPIQDSYDQFLDKESTNYGFSVSYKLSQKATSDTLVKIQDYIAK